jgi:ParB family chromosome partitioning protein
MSKLLGQAQERTMGRGLKRARDADHDPADTAREVTPPAADSTAPAALPAQPTALQVPAGARGAVLAVEIFQVAANPLNTRDVDARPDKLADLRASIAAHGQMQPSAAVTRAAFLASFPEYEQMIGQAAYVQVSGGRRRAALLAEGNPTIDIVLRDSLATTRAGFISATAAENLDRDDLDPIEEARAVQQLLAEVGTGAAVAAQLRRTGGWVSQRKNLLRLAPEVQDALRATEEEHRLPLREVREWHTWPADEQVAALDEWRRHRGFTAVKPDEEAPGERRPPQPRASRIAAAVRRLGGTPSEIAASLRAELPAEDRRALAEELLRD